MAKFDIKTLEGWLWEAACKIRGEIDAPKYKDYILPLIFLKRLSDVFDDEIEKLAKEYGENGIARELVEEDHSLVWFYMPEKARWTDGGFGDAHNGDAHNNITLIITYIVVFRDIPLLYTFLHLITTNIIFLWASPTPAGYARQSEPAHIQQSYPEIVAINALPVFLPGVI